MASIYTYEDFQNALNASGMAGQFSEADLRLAQQNPDAGMGILNYKKKYANATTDEARALANLGAENIRSGYGEYTGGADGSGFYPNQPSPSSFNFAAAPSYSGSYSSDVADLWEQQKNYGEYSYGLPQPTYESRYDDKVQNLLNELINREAFSYDPETDPLYSQYRKQYTREGQRATADALGAAAAASGGIPSSYAQTAAGQAANYYASQMTDKIPELYQLAYNKYLQEYQMKLSDLGAVQGAEQSDYDKFLNELAQYNNNRAFDYQTWTDRYNQIANNLQTAQAMDQIDYTKYLNELQQYNTDREFAYQNLLDEINSQTLERQEAAGQKQQAFDNALALMELLGYAPDNAGSALGVKAGTPTAEQAYILAQLEAAAASGGGYGSGYYGGSTTQEETPAAGLSEADISAIKQAYGGTALTEAQWNALLSSNPGITDKMLTEAGFTKMSGNGLQLDMSSILALGYGPISEERLNQLVQSGQVEEYEENGLLKFRKTSGGLVSLLGLN